MQTQTIHQMIRESLRVSAPVRDLPRYRYSVTLYKHGMVYLGTVVSHLSIADWATMHGYEIDCLGAVISCQARPEERTNLLLSHRLTFLSAMMVKVL